LQKLNIHFPLLNKKMGTSNPSNPSKTLYQQYEIYEHLDLQHPETLSKQLYVIAVLNQIV